MKSLKPTVIILSLIFAGVSIYLIVHAVSNNYLSTKKDTPSVSQECKLKGHPKVLTIRNDAFNTPEISANRCDTLEIINQDDTDRVMAFGEHDEHKAYDGVIEKNLGKGDSFAITLNQTGRFIIHDHYDESVEAVFIVN